MALYFLSLRLRLSGGGAVAYGDEGAAIMMSNKRFAILAAIVTTAVFAAGAIVGGLIVLEIARPVHRSRRALRGLADEPEAEKPQQQKKRRWTA